MTEKINVLTVQRELTDFSLVNEIDRQNDLFNFAKLAGMNQNDLLPFVRLFELYKIPPDVDSMPEVLLNYMLLNNHITPKVDLNITHSGNKPWDYFIPKDIPTGAIRIITPSRTRVRIGTGDNRQLYIPAGQLMDYKLDDIRMVFNTLMFIPIKTQPFILRCISNKNQISYNSPKKSIIANSKLSDFIQLFKEQGIPIRKSHYYVNMLYASLINLDLSPLYSEYLKGNDKLFDSMLSRYIIAYKDYLIDIKNQHLIIESRLHKKLLLSFIPKNIKYDPIWPINKIMNLLTPEIQNYVKSSFRARQEFIEAFTKNTCPHIHEYFLIRNAPSLAKRRKAYNKLKTFLDTSNKDKSSWITCKNCSFNALCPHVKVMIEAELNDVKYSIMLSQLDNYVNHNSFEEVVIGYDNKYCKICSEHITSMGEIDDISDQYRNTYKDINSRLWAYSNIIYGHLKFNPLVNVQDFAIMITNNILPVLATINSMNSNQVGDDLIYTMNTYAHSGEISPKLDLYIWLFIYAYVLHMIRENITNPSPHHIKVRLNLHSGRNVAAYAEALFSHIKANHRSLIDYIKTDTYEDMFKRAYTLLANANIQFAMERIYSRAYELFNFLINSSHFHFTYDIYTLTTDIDYSTLTTEDYEKVIEAILGETMIEASKKTDVNVLREIPHIKVKGIDPSVKVTLDNYNKYYKDIIFTTYNIYYKWFHSDSRDDTIFDQLKIYDKIGGDIDQYKYRIVTNSFKCERAYNRKIYTHPYELSSIINKDGDMYDWDILVYNDGTEMRRGTKLDKSKAVVDYKSSKMDILRSKTDQIDVALVTKKYIYINNIKNFFTFYEVLCPEGGIHTYSDKEVCTKCGYDKTTNSSYYEKYEAKFKTEMSIIIKDDKNDINDKETTMSISTDKVFVIITQDDKLIPENMDIYIKQAQQWKYNNLPILNVAQMINIRQDVLFYLGAMSGLTYKYIMNVATIDNAPKPTSRTSPQVTILYASYLNIVSLYNLIRISNNIDNLYKPITSKYSNYIDLASKLKIDGCIKYNARIEVIKAKEGPEMLYLCILQSLCELIIDVSKTGTDEFYIDCSKYLIQNVLKEQTSFCKAVEPDMGLIRKRKDITLQENVEYDRIYEEEYEAADLQMFVNDADYDGHNDTLD